MHALQGWNRMWTVSLLPKLISSQHFQVTFYSSVWVKKSSAPCSAMTIQVQPQQNPENFCMNTSPRHDSPLWTHYLLKPEILTKIIFSAAFCRFTSNITVTKWEILALSVCQDVFRLYFHWCRPDEMSFPWYEISHCRMTKKKKNCMWLIDVLVDNRWWITSVFKKKNCLIYAASENVLFSYYLLLFICSSYIIIRLNLHWV